MKSQLLYITVVEANLERYEAKIKSDSTVSDKMKDYIERKKKEILSQKNALLQKEK